MRWDHANIFLKTLEEPPESATLILLTSNPYLLLPTIRSRCIQFLFGPLEEKLVEDILRQRSKLPAKERKLAAQLSEGSPGVALAMDPAEAQSLRATALTVLRAVVESHSATNLFEETTQLAKSQKVAFETVLEVLYSLLTDLLELSTGCAAPALRNATLGKDLASLSKRVDPLWVARAVAGLDQLSSRLRRNINRQLGFDAVALSLGAYPRGDSVRS